MFELALGANLVVDSTGNREWGGEGGLKTWKMIIYMSVLNRTTISYDWRFDNLSRRHLQSQKWVVFGQLKGNSWVAYENNRFSSLFAAGDVSRGGTSATQRQKFHADDANQC